MSFKKWPGRVLMIVLACVAVFLVVRAIWNVTSNAALERYVKKAAASGVPLKYADLGPACPAGESAAPLWKAAAALMDIDALRAANLGGSPYNEWLNGARESETVGSVYAASIDHNRRVIDLYLESAGLSCGRDPERKSIFKDPQEAMKRLWAARMIGVEAVLRAGRGDVQGGLEECLKGLKAVMLSLDEPSLINALVAIACMKYLTVGLDRIVDGNAVEPESLHPFLRVLSSADWSEAFKRYVRAERVGAVDTAEAFLDRKEIRSWLFRPLLRSRFVRYLTRFDDMERIYGLPAAERASAILEFDRRAENPGWLDRLALRFLPEEARPGDPTMGATALKESTLEALMDTARIGLAARIYRVREGRWPESPAVLVPEFLDKEPRDPFTGKTYIFRADADGLIVYSVGANLKDEGGRGTYQITQLVMPKDDDWAWRDSFKK